MKTEYPDFKRLKVHRDHLEKDLNKKDNKILADFLEFCGITANPDKVMDKKTLMLQIRDVMEKGYDKITKMDLIKFMNVLNKSEKKEWTKHEIKIILKKFLRWKYPDWSTRFGNLNEIIKNKTIGVNYEKLNSSTLVSDEEIEKILRSARSLRDKSIIILTYELGARPHELRLLKWRQIKLNRDNPTVTLLTSKGNREGERELPIKDSIIHLERYKQEYPYSDVRDSDFVFPKKSNRDEPMTEGMFSYVIRTAAQRAGIKRQIYGYLLRHTRLTEIRRKGLGERYALMFGGHKDARMGEIYVHLNGDDLRSEVLSKVYSIEEPSAEQISKWQKEIKELKTLVGELKTWKDHWENEFKRMKQKPHMFGIATDGDIIEFPTEDMVRKN